MRSRVRVGWLGGFTAALLMACRSEQAPAGPTRVDILATCAWDLSVSPPMARLHVGDTVRLRATLTCPPTVFRWSSSGAKIASVDSTGLVQAASLGAAIVTATAVADPSATGSSAIVVIP